MENGKKKKKRVVAAAGAWWLLSMSLRIQFCCVQRQAWDQAQSRGPEWTKEYHFETFSSPQLMVLIPTEKKKFDI